MTESNINKSEKSSKAPAAVLLALAVVITIAAYWPVLFNFFAGDDFVHLIWLKDAVVKHELIWRNFHSSWLDGTTTKFYRPLISIFMVSDYVLFNKNGLGFHWTNLTFHLLSVVSIFYIGRHLAASTMRLTRGADGAKIEGPRPDDSFSLAWPFFAALLFGLYPLHPEAVSWITGRVDAVVTAFITLSFWCYLSHRQSSKNILAQIFCYVFFVLALLSKEMAITLPGVFVIYEFCFPQRLTARGLSLLSLSKRLLDMLKPTWTFFIVIAVYFVVRLLSLGTFVGGYDDSLFFISDIKAFIKTWLNGLRQFIEPMNRELISVRSIEARLWHISLAISAISGIVNLIVFRPFFRLYLFLFGWLILSLLPVYKVFAIADDLQGSRLAYLATVPLAMLLAQTTIALTRSQFEKGGRILATAAFCFAAFYILNVNNSAWVNGGTQANDIRAALSKLYKELPGDPQVMFVGLPDQEHGAYICRNALPGMTRAPQLERDIINAVLVDRFEPIFPFGYVKQSLFDEQAKVKLFRWDRRQKSFAPVDLSAIAAYPQKESVQYTGNGLKEIAKPKAIDSVKFEWNEKGELGIEGSGGRFGRPEIQLSPRSGPCFAMEFVAVTLQVSDAGEIKEGVDLLYTNDLVPQFELRCRTHAAMKSEPLAPAEMRIILPLRSLPEWSLGGKSHDFILKLPHNFHGNLVKVEVLPESAVLPKINFAGGGYLGSKGYLHVGKEPVDIDYDVSNIAGAAGTFIEVTRANLLFEEQNCTALSRVMDKSLSRQLKETRGKASFTNDILPSMGIYQVRIWATDKNGVPFGQASDHIVLAKD